MIECPYEYVLTPAELQKLGEMHLTWSHNEHIIGNCLKRVLGLSDDEAMAIVFPMSLETRLQYLNHLKGRMTPVARQVFAELNIIARGMQPLRNTVTHAILVNDLKDGTLFHMRSKDRTFTKEEVFECEEMTNYAAVLGRCLRSELGFDSSLGVSPPLPDRPGIPKALREYIPNGK